MSIEQTHFLVYRITNITNGYIYIGCHKTRNLDDGYMGSGKLIKLAIAEYGIENFKKEIIHNFDSSELMFATERLEIAAQLPEYNLNIGGSGGFEYINKTRKNVHATSKLKGRQRPKEVREKISNTLRGHSVSEVTKAKIRESIKRTMTPERKLKSASFKGRKHTEETKRRISESLLARRLDEIELP
jgi:hypothetical protein